MERGRAHADIIQIHSIEIELIIPCHNGDHIKHHFDVAQFTMKISKSMIIS